MKITGKDNCKILFFTDIHQNYDAVKKIPFDKYDICVCGGDILDPTNPDLEVAKKIAEIIPKETFIVPGNCDKGKEIASIIDSFQNIHKKMAKFLDINFFGIGFSRSLKEDLIFYRDWFLDETERIKTFLKESSSPFILNACGIKSLEAEKIEMIPMEEAIKNQSALISKFDFFLEEEIKDVFEDSDENDFNIILTHSPPRGMLDKLPGLPNIGSVSIAETVKKIRPKLLLCGHFHENVGTLFKDGVVVFNPGAVKDNLYGEIEINGGSIKTNIIRV